MRRQKQQTSTIFGGTSLLVILAVLCLTMFALLSLSTVLAQRRLSDGALEAISEYYAADLEAETLFARLRAGEQIPGITREGDRFCWTCPVSEDQVLYVEAEKNGESWTILRWQAVARPEAADDALPVWDGQIKEDTP